jgi:PAS domain-containing protein
MRDHPDSSANFGEYYWQTPPAVEWIDKPVSDEVPYRLLAEYLPTLCWCARADGSILWYNRRWHTYCGTTPGEVEGWGWMKV